MEAWPVGVICVSKISFGAAGIVVVVVMDDAARLFWRMLIEVNAEDGFIVMMMLWSTKHW
jgi:hypothetical protein